MELSKVVGWDEWHLDTLSREHSWRTALSFHTVSGTDIDTSTVHLPLSLYQYFNCKLKTKRRCSLSTTIAISQLVGKKKKTLSEFHLCFLNRPGSLAGNKFRWVFHGERIVCQLLGEVGCSLGVHRGRDEDFKHWSHGAVTQLPTTTAVPVVGQCDDAFSPTSRRAAVQSHRDR